jgi:hypothetical protein
MITKIKMFEKWNQLIIGEERDVIYFSNNKKRLRYIFKIKKI